MNLLRASSIAWVDSMSRIQTSPKANMAASPAALLNDTLANIGARYDVQFALPQPRTVERIPSGIPAIDELTAAAFRAAP